MRSGDAEIEFWLEAEHSKRSYCVTITSVRRGPYRSKRWKVPSYTFAVELWEGDKPTGLCFQSETRYLSEALRLSRRAADRLEGEAKELLP